MTGHDIIVIGASAGGLQALQDLLRELPAGLAASLFIVVHTAPSSTGYLPDILNRDCDLPVAHARDHEPIVPGRVYVAPPDHHLLIERGHVRLSKGPRENGFRPAVDPLFRTAASAYGPRVVGVVLSGGLNDGTQGLLQIKRQGGIAIAQDPAEALVPSMPASAAQTVRVDHVLRVAQIAAELIALPARSSRNGNHAMARSTKNGRDVAEAGTSALKDHLRPRPPSRFTCPECGGALWEIRDGKLVRYRCHVGHGYTAEGLLDAQTTAVEQALWTALRSLEEKAEMRRQMGDRAEKQRLDAAARHYRDSALTAEAQADIIRNVLIDDEPAEEPMAAITLHRSNGKKRKPAARSRAGRGSSK